MSEEVRVGVYICHCGGNISDVVDVKKVVEELAEYPNVKVSRNFMFMCSDPGQQMIIDDIKQNDINRVVVSACSPALHELTFRKALQRAGLNPHMYENVNIREQVSWVHKGRKEDATRKAIRLTKAGVEKIARQDPLEAIKVNAEKHVAVIGAGVAGMRAAVSLAKRGLGVTLIEMSDKVGGRLLEMDRIYPTGEKALDVVKDLASEVANEKAINLHLNSSVAGIDGYVGNFTLTVQSGETKSQVRAGAIILATGFNHYQPHDGEFGYKQSPKVVTLPEFWSLLKDGKVSAKNIAFMHCVGSRQFDGLDEPQADGKVNDYCSRLCCTAGLHAMEDLLEKLPGTRVYNVYKDIRTYGRGHEDYYERMSKKGVRFFRYADGEKPEFVGHKLKVRDILTWGEELEVPVDMLVLVTGIMPRDIFTITDALKLPTGVDRFLQEVHPKLRPVELANNGVLIAGCCQGPMDVIESCASAEAAAVKATILLAKGEIELDPYVARVVPERCDGCEKCLSECEYKGALTMTNRPEGGPLVATVNKALCVGCGACVAVCPTRAIQIAGWSLDQFDAMVDALVSEEYTHA